MKKKQIKLLIFKKVNIANLGVENKIKGGESGVETDCGTNTNTNSFLCPPESLTCRTHVLATCPPQLDTRNGC
ncbi:hypothetical protein KORDIASMS9_01308 [Kordia sp. SMS9]|uniref:hypothetical protein n=1 Tax=Kordia sp. SMS9 TaxID=2282170 RepID=UPI000E0DCBE1|nr:hypothetical protein [Kordia sp. SMS9]AXG69089.1 hypothetical protein KORDIASMS9_01308 [Kordia sp. SMS9]